MLNVHWTPTARRDLRTITEYIAKASPSAARRLRKRLEESVQILPEHPYLYRRSERMPGLREIVAHPNYLVFYRVELDCIEVVRVIHGRRQFPQPMS